MPKDPIERVEFAEKILKSNGYRNLEYLGRGAASIVFKAVRNSKSGGEKTVAAKVCHPSGDSFASLSDEISAAVELKKLKNEFKSKIAEAQKCGQTELVEKYQKSLKHLFKYLTIPKLKGSLRTEVKDGGKEWKYAIFEAPLADSDMSNYGVGEKKTEIVTMPDPEMEGWTLAVVKVEINYSELKKAIKGILKGLKVIHDQGMFHADMRPGNVLKKFDAGKGRYRYSLTDFGTLRSGNSDDQAYDLDKAFKLFFCFWLDYVGFDKSELDTIFLNYSKESIVYYCNMYGRDGCVELYTQPQKRKLGLVRHQRGCYYLTKDDREFLNFIKKFFEGGFKSAGEALSDLWLQGT